MNKSNLSTERIGSRKRYIAPAVVGVVSGALSLIKGISGASKAKQAKEDARLAAIKQEQNALNASFNQQRQADNFAYAEYEKDGVEGVNYYKKGGKIGSKYANKFGIGLAEMRQNSTQNGGQNPNLPVSNGGFQTKGGNLVPIGEGVELAVGNRHNETAIDGVSGIQLSQNGEQVAEIENKEVLADGNVVYSDRLLYDKGKSYADMMIKLTKKRNQLEKEQVDAPNKAKKNSIDRQLAGLNMAEETLFKTQEAHKEMEGTQVLKNIFATGGVVKPGQPLPVPKWMERFWGKENMGKYAGYDTNALGDYRDPNDSRVIISKNGRPKYPFEPYTPKMINPTIDKSISMSNGSSELLNGVTGAVSSVVNSLGTNTDTSPNVVASTAVNTDNDITPVNTTMKGYKVAEITPIDITRTPVLKDVTGNNTSKGLNINWTKAGSLIGSFAPKIIDNIVNRALTKNAPELPNFVHSVARPLETRVNINAQLAETRRRNASIRKGILDNTSNSNNAKSNMVATSLASSRQVDDLLASKQNQEMALRNANAQNQQAVFNTNTAQNNERAMMEHQRRVDMNTANSANVSNLVQDISSTINEVKLDNQFDSKFMADLMDDPMGSKANLFAQNKEFMNNKTNRDFIFNLARTKKNPVLVQYLKDNYNFTD